MSRTRVKDGKGKCHELAGQLSYLYPETEIRLACI